MIKLIKKVSLIGLLCFCMALLTSCNTIQGMGKDLEHLGSALQKSTDKKENIQSE